MRWRISLVVALAPFASLGCSQPPNPTAPADAAAASSIYGAFACLLPVALPDRWAEAGGSGNDPGYFNPESGDLYSPWPGDPYFTGYSEMDDVGTQMAYTSSSWYYRWLPPGQSGQKDYVENILSCDDASPGYAVGDDISIQKGGLSRQALAAFQTVIDEDPNAAWNDFMDCVTESEYRNSSDATECRDTRRFKTIPFFAPDAAPEGRNKALTIVFFADVFLEQIDGESLYLRLVRVKR